MLEKQTDLHQHDRWTLINNDWQKIMNASGKDWHLGSGKIHCQGLSKTREKERKGENGRYEKRNIGTEGNKILIGCLQPQNH